MTSYSAAGSEGRKAGQSNRNCVDDKSCNNGKNNDDDEYHDDLGIRHAKNIRISTYFLPRKN